jgi:hypothetical protein
VPHEERCEIDRVGCLRADEDEREADRHGDEDGCDEDVTGGDHAVSSSLRSAYQGVGKSRAISV